MLPSWKRSRFHDDAGKDAVDLEGEGLGRLVVVLVQQQATQVGVGARRTRVVAEQRREAAGEVVEERQRLAEVGGSPEVSRG